ncbi:glycosyltransferase [Altericista sp. CCNU0014]|uniref:glycosyltransferase n=1 Tax=Altericista sp. CCNU0014 TaxID=3082949 RepID=UPI003850DF56
MRLFGFDDRGLPPSMKVLILSNQELSDIYAKWKAEGEQARAEHLWGATTLGKYGIEVDILPYQKFGLLKLMSKVNVLGDLDQQLRVLLSASKYDAIYSAHHLTTPLLALLRKLKLLKTPLVAIAYQSFVPGWVSRLFTALCVDGNDRIICLNPQLKADLIHEFHLSEAKLSVAEWGVDLPFYEAIATHQASAVATDASAPPLILSTGKTYRDYATLLKGIESLNCQLKICCFDIESVKTGLSLPANAHFYEGILPWRAVLQEYRKAYAVAIPLGNYPQKPNNAVGLTVLLEAIALGKPVVMTRNNLSRYVMDIEAAGIGLWVDAGDVKGWQAALGYLLDHPAEAAMMGQRARQLAEQELNLEVFSAKVAAVLQPFG